MMDCLEAQRVLSEAVDGQPVSAEVLAQARQHCLGCRECARFVRGLALLQRAGAPKTPPGMHTRIMASVHDAQASEAAALEAQAAQDRRARVTAEAETRSMPETEGFEREADAQAEQPAPAVVTLSGLRRNVRRRSVLAWASAAAAVLIVATIAAVWGVRGIISPTNTNLRSFAPLGSTSGKSTDTAAPDQGRLGAPQPDALGESSGSASKVAGDYITVNDFVYRLAPTVALTRSELTTAGSTDSALDTGGAVTTLTVYATSTSGRVAVISGDRILAFDIVSRTVDGETFMLTSKSIEAFGVWASLPTGFTEPTTADGAPTFVEAGEDDLGVAMFSRPGIPVTDGFAIGPGTPDADPAAGDPNWTWWSRPTR